MFVIELVLSMSPLPFADDRSLLVSIDSRNLPSHFNDELGAMGVKMQSRVEKQCHVYDISSSTIGMFQG